MSLNPTSPVLVNMWYSCEQFVLSFTKSNESPPTVNKGVPEFPRNFTILATDAVIKKNDLDKTECVKLNCVIGQSAVLF